MNIILNIYLWYNDTATRKCQMGCGAEAGISRGYQSGVVRTSFLNLSLIRLCQEGVLRPWDHGEWKFRGNQHMWGCVYVCPSDSGSASESCWNQGQGCEWVVAAWRNAKGINTMTLEKKLQGFVKGLLRIIQQKLSTGKLKQAISENILNRWGHWGWNILPWGF